jgi:hypothetical protein
MIDPEKWAEQMDKELRAEEEKNAAQGQVFLAKRKLLDEHTPLLFKLLTGTLTQLATAFNKRRGNALNVEDEGGDQFAIRRSSDAGAALLSVQFQHLQNTIGVLITPGSWFQNYEAKVIPGSGEGIVRLSHQDPETGNKRIVEVDEIASVALEELLKTTP